MAGLDRFSLIDGRFPVTMFSLLSGRRSLSAGLNGPVKVIHHFIDVSLPILLRQAHAKKTATVCNLAKFHEIQRRSLLEDVLQRDCAQLSALFHNCRLFL